MVMSSTKHAVRNGLVAAVVAGLVAGLVSRDKGAALTSAVFAGVVACVVSFFLGGSVELDELDEGPVEFDA